MWQLFWETYFRRYGELRPYHPEELMQWRIVAATTSLVWDRSLASNDQRVSFVKAALAGTEHPWLSGSRIMRLIAGSDRNCFLDDKP
jgi:hypothetical protein